MAAAPDKTEQQMPPPPTMKKGAAVQASPLLTEAARLEPAEVLRLVENFAEGLSSDKAAERLAQFGPPRSRARAAAQGVSIYARPGGALP